MNIAKKLFKTSGKIGKKALKSAVSDAKSITKSKGFKASSEPDYADPYAEFEAKYAKTCDKMENKVYSVDTDNIDPDKNVAAYKKMFALAHELEDFCKSHGSGGTEYYQDCYSDMYESIQSDLDFYMAEQYNEDKAYFEEYQARKKAIRSLSSKITKAIKQAGGSLPQTELKKTLSEDDLFYYNATIKELTEAGKVEKAKSGGRVTFQIK